jgi:hypothetical protein
MKSFLVGLGMCKVSAIFAEANRLKSTARGEEAMVKLGVSNEMMDDLMPDGINNMI